LREITEILRHSSLREITEILRHSSLREIGETKVVDDGFPSDSEAALQKLQYRRSAQFSFRRGGGGG
jgi:hypothetical protein